MIRRLPDNAELAGLLERVGDLLHAQGADVWRVRAWRGGAATLRGLDHPAAVLLQEAGVKGLVRLPRIGKSIAAAIEEYVTTGRLALLDRLEGSTAPEDLFTTVPGIGSDLAHRIHEGLGAETLEDLEAAAWDGRLEAVPGFGPRRVLGVRESLETILGRAGQRRARRNSPHPTVPETTLGTEALLRIDALYREGAAEGRWERITPRRFNPEREAWLPVLHTVEQGWHVTAMYSNTARAHTLGTTKDWVLIWFERDGMEGRATVVTEPQGRLADRRVVRGRETECAALYARTQANVVEPPEEPPG